MLIKNQKTVAIAMSGGVDSSVSAMLLKKKGYSVIGISMHLIGSAENISPDINAANSSVFGYDKTSEKKSCCSIQDLIDAKRVSVKLGIPHFVINLENEFRSSVINPFIEEYLSGKTPNPCISCNNYLKFDILLQRAKELGADFLSTGHYARIAKNTDGEYFLLKSRNLLKDQSYVLYNLKQEALKNIMFPVGNLSKESVRKIAHEFGFDEISGKKDSTDICFIPSGNYSNFIEKSCGRDKLLKIGNIKNMEGAVVGVHSGIYNYTVGQRKGLGISSKTPLYITKISAETNEIFVGAIENCYNNEMRIENFNFINPNFIKRLGEIDLTVKIRYSSPNYRCRAFITNEENNADYRVSDYRVSEFNSDALAENNSSICEHAIENNENARISIRVEFEHPVKFITPGQSAVLYWGLKVIGGGIIV